MTISQILEQVKTLSPQERKELAKLLIDMMDVPQQEHKPKTGAEIVAMLEALDEPIELVDPHIEDPVEWVKTQRRKRQEKLKPYWDGEA
jgi:hypothetical protein